MNAKYPGLETVINGNGAVAHVMSHVCDGVIGYPITPSTEISENYERFRAGGGVNVWGRHPFFYEPEGEHSAQSGALGAALTGGKYVSNASSSQGVLYALESHYVTVGKKVGGFVLHVAARVVSKHSLNVMAGHDDVYALLPAGYTILFGADPQEAADLAAIAYRVAADTLVPVANAMDGFATSHMMTETRLPEPELLKTFLGDPSERIACPTVAQEMLYGAKGRVHQLTHWLRRHASAFDAAALADLTKWLSANADAVEADDAGARLAETAALVPADLAAPWARLWRNAWPKGTRRRVPALVDPGNPGLTGGVQNQPDYQSGVVDHHTHFVADVPRFVRAAMDEYGDLTGRRYAPVMTWGCDDAETVVIGLGSVTQDAEAVAEWLRKSGRKVGVVAIKQLQPFPEAELVAAIAGKRAVTVLERSDVTALTGLVSAALLKARENADGIRHPGIPALDAQPRLTTAIFGLGAHDLQPRHLVAVFDAMEDPQSAPLVWVGSQFFDGGTDPFLAGLQDRLAAAYPETRRMALATGPNPPLLPEGGMRIRFHSVGGYGTVATGKLVTDILSGLLGLHSKASPKYGSEKSGAPTNYYITLSPEPVKITNAELEDVEIVVSPDHKVFAHTDPLRGLVEGGTFILQSDLSPFALWHALPRAARATIREKKIHLHVIDAFKVAEHHAPSPELATRMMGIAFIGALAAKVAAIGAGRDPSALLDAIRHQIEKKFGGKGEAIVAGNMSVIREGFDAVFTVPWDDPAYAEAEVPAPLPHRAAAGAGAMVGLDRASAPSALFDRGYFDEIVGRPMREGRIGESPVLPGSGLFMPAASAAAKDKGLFRRHVPAFDAEACSGCLDCSLVCPDAALPATVHEVEDLLATAAREGGFDADRAARLQAVMPALAEAVRTALRSAGDRPTFATAVAAAGAEIAAGDAALAADFAVLHEVLAFAPVARTSVFFDQFEKKEAGSGGLFSIAVDPTKCSGCMECLTVCGTGALVRRAQDDELREEMATRFAFFSATAGTPKRFTEDLATPVVKRLLLDRANYYSSTGGHGACRGCGEVTAIRQITAAAHSLGDHTTESERAATEGLLAALADKRARIAGDAARTARIDAAYAVLERRLFDLESGPTGAGRSPMVFANATGCSSVYCSTFPFNPYRDPWVNSLFQDAPALAKGIFEGLAADHVATVRARRIAELELADAYDPALHDKPLRRLAWADFTAEELTGLPIVVSMGGDGATYDIGFGALSKVLSTHTPIKVVILNTGAYSNTGGQASTSSLVAQDADLASVGAAHAGKQDDRKELGLIAAFHPKVMVVQTTPALQGHFLKNVLAALAYTGGPVVIDVYTPCQGEHGIGDAVSSEHARLAVLSRTNPVFVHDPERGPAEKKRFSLVGNPNASDDWTTVELEWDDADGTVRTMEVPLTPADFALQEGRFKKQFKAGPLADDADGVPIHDYVDLAPEAREGRVPFVWQVKNRKLRRIPVPPAIVALVEERRRHWRMLQHLAGIDEQKRVEAATAELEALRGRYRELSERLGTLAGAGATSGEAPVRPGSAVAEPSR